MLLHALNVCRHFCLCCPQHALPNGVVPLLPARVARWQGLYIGERWLVTDRSSCPFWWSETLLALSYER